MPVTLSVSQVRQALYHVSGASGGGGAPSTAVLGKWFHECMARLIGDNGQPGLLAVLADVDADVQLWRRTLAQQVYRDVIGPRLTSQQAALHELASQILTLWEAVTSACDWLADLAWSLRTEHPSSRSAWNALLEMLSAEEPLSCVLNEPGWSNSVKLIGQADAVVRLPPDRVWCAVEFKVGQTSPEVDLGQACLYHLMLSNAPGISPSNDGTLALVSFRPQRHEQLFSAADLQSARQRLVDLIGKLAGVDASQAAAPTTATRPAGVSQLAGTEKPRPSPTAAPTSEHLELGQGLVRTWSEYGVNVSLDQTAIAGPTFVRFPLTLGRGTKVKDVERCTAELQVRLQLKEEPLISRDNGQLVIDVQRPDRQTIWFDDIRAELPSPDPQRGGSKVPVGVDLFRRLVCADLARPEHAHLLVAGTTGSGKSEWLRLAVAGLMATNTPETLQFLVIDPKRNAFHALRDSPFLWRPIVFPDEQPAAEILELLAAEMDRRYRLFDGVDAFHQLMERSNETLPRIVCICDEYRDLISRGRRERQLIEAQICRLGAKARAAGIHLILATQEPSRDTIKGALDSNIPARVGLKMNKGVESRMLLSTAGAEKLLGNGDLLFKDIGDPCRLQAPLLTEANRAEIFGRRST